MNTAHLKDQQVTTTLRVSELRALDALAERLELTRASTVRLLVTLATHGDRDLR